MVKKKVSFGTKQFDSKTKAEAYVRSTLKTIGLQTSLKSVSQSAFEEVLTILQCHPNNAEKLKNMVDIKINLNSLNPKAYEVNIINTDGSITDISWKQCVGSENIAKNNLQIAMRYSIEPQIKDFRSKANTETDTCVLCEFPLKNIVTHVDHVVHFEKLTNDFKTNTTCTIPTTFINTSDGSNRKTFCEADAAFEKEWVAYHLEHATLRLICKRCNLSREKHKKEM